MRTSRRSAALLTLAAAIGLAGAVVPAATAVAAAPAAEECDTVQDPPAQLPLGVEEGDYVFVTQYRGLVVDITCGRLELVEPTGWDSCWFLYRDEALRYPC
ncbi:hypothetical protein ACI797_13665 [Geodermatophilus sp. SYSU D00691]